MDADATRELIRTVVEECWSDPAGIERMRGFIADGYVHHTPFGDTDFDGFVRGLDWIDEQFDDRTYRVEHVLVDGDLAAAYLRWTAIRAADGVDVEGSGAYHCRLTGDRIAEDWDVFFPVG